MEIYKHASTEIQDAYAVWHDNNVAFVVVSSIHTGPGRIEAVVAHNDTRRPAAILAEAVVRHHFAEDNWNLALAEMGDQYPVFTFRYDGE